MVDVAASPRRTPIVQDDVTPREAAEHLRRHDLTGGTAAPPPGVAFWPKLPGPGPGQQPGPHEPGLDPAPAGEDEGEPQSHEDEA
jgi:hypothetical protein